MIVHYPALPAGPGEPPDPPAQEERNETLEDVGGPWADEFRRVQDSDGKLVVTITPATNVTPDTITVKAS